jgi:hypothetical protein
MEGENNQNTYISELPTSAVDVSNIINQEFVPRLMHSENDLIQDITGNVFYSDIENKFYVKKFNKKSTFIYKVLKWRQTRAKYIDANKEYTYEYVLIPYKKKQPIRILKLTWNKLYKK